MKTRLLYSLLLFESLFWIAGSGIAQNLPVDQPTVTVYRQSIELHDAMQFTNPQEPRNFVVRPGVPNVDLTLNLERAKPSAVAVYLVGQAALLHPRLTCALDGDIAHVYLRESVPLNPVAEEKVTVKLQRAPASAVWKRLFSGTGISASLPQEVRELVVTLDDENQPRRVVVYHLVRQLSEKVSNLWINSREWKLLRFKPEEASPKVEGQDGK
jgi:hypothetical protein